jgi:hypothetical protein
VRKTLFAIAAILEALLFRARMALGSDHVKLTSRHSEPSFFVLSFVQSKKEKEG